MANEKYIKLSNITPEVFLSGKEGYKYVISNSSDNKAILFFNSEEIVLDSSSSSYTIDTSNMIDHTICLSTDQLNTTPFKCEMQCKNDDDIIDASYIIEYNPVFVKNNNYVSQNVINTDNSSFMLLRTNPLLTGNIKLVIDDNNDMFIDTFKVNEVLSNRKYRKVPVSTKSYYSNDIRNAFSDIDTNSLYDIPQLGNNHNNIIINQFDKQYVDIYNYGVKLNDDKLYSENFSMLAPLWINDKLPDFFIIFKIKEPYKNNSESALDRFNYCIKHGEIVKTYDIRKNSKLGNYLYNIQSELQTYKTSAYITANDKDFNNWYGISVDRGIITQSVETIYDMMKSADSNVSLDKFITEGYKRNRLLNPYLINCEFMFNDKDESKNDKSENFEFNQYIGLYISNNQYKEFEYITPDTSIFDINDINDVSISTLLSERIFNINTNSNISDKFERLSSDIDSSKYFIGDNILNCSVIATNVDQYLKKSFITITINKPLLPGEHLRIIDQRDDSSNNIIGHIYDVCGSNITNYALNNDEIINYNTYDNKDNKDKKDIIVVHNNIFEGYDNTHSYKDPKDIIREQIREIVNSFNNMTDLPFYISNYDDTHISFMSNDNNTLIFERISAPNSQHNAIENKEVITYHDNFIIEPTYLEISAIDNISNKDKMYMPLNYESNNGRLAYIVGFTKSFNNPGDDISMYIIDKTPFDNKHTNLICMCNGGSIDIIRKFDIGIYEYNNNNNSFENHNISEEFITNLLISPFDSNKYIFYGKKNIINNNIINLYVFSPLSLNIAGIMPIKDFNFNVLDANLNKDLSKSDLGIKESYIYYDIDFISKKLNRGDKFTTDNNTHYYITDAKGGNTGQLEDSAHNSYGGDYDFPLRIEDKTYTCVKDGTYIVENGKLDGRGLCAYTINYNIINETNKNYSFYNIPLVTPTNCKWTLSGRDILNKEIRIDSSLKYNNKLSDSSIILFGHPMTRFLTDGIDNPYIYNRFNDFVYINSIDTSTTMRDYIINKNGNIMELLSNNDYISNMFSRVYYNNDSNNLECIVSGQKVILNSNNADINLEIYNNYLIMFVNSSINNYQSKPEIIIDTKDKVIMCVNYINAYNVGYSYYNAPINRIYKTTAKKYYTEEPIKFYRYSGDVKLDSNVINLQKYDISLGDCSIFITALNDRNNLYYNKSYTYDISINELEKDSSYIIVDSSIIQTFSDVSINNTNIDYVYNIKNDNITINDTTNILNNYIIYDSSKVKFMYDTGNANYKYTDIPKTINFYENIPLNTTIKKINDNIHINNGITLKFKKLDKKINYYCNPEFKDIFEFCTIDSSLDNILNKSFIGANTKVKKINNINQLWINRVYNKYPKTERYIDFINNFNIFKSIYDDDYYRLYDYNNKDKDSSIYCNSDEFIKINGMKCVNDTKTFFGSIAPTIKDDIVIVNWPKLYTHIYEDNKKINQSFSNNKVFNVKIDITTTIINYILFNYNIIEKFNNDAEAAISYIKKLISNYFIINNKNNIEVYKFYNKDIINNDDKIIKYDEKNSKFEKVIHINNDIIYQRGIYYLTMELPIDNYQYAIKYTINR